MIIINFKTNKIFFEMKLTGMVLASLMMLSESPVNAGYGFGKCPSPAENSVDINRYLGRWYSITADWTIPFQGPWIGCVNANYALNDDGSVKVFNYAYVWPWSFTAGLTSIEGAAQCFPTEGKCNVAFFSDPSVDGKRNYQIIDTDYDNYSIVYNCDEYLGGLIYNNYFWILSRTPTMSSQEYDARYATISEAVPSYQQWFWRSFTVQGDWCQYQS